MDPLRPPSDPGPFIVIFGLIAAAIPGFLSSWKHPGIAISSVFMSLASIVFAINGSRLTGDVIFAVIWTGSMLLAVLSRVIQVLSATYSVPPSTPSVSKSSVDVEPMRRKWLSEPIDPTAPPADGRGDPPKGPIIR